MEGVDEIDALIEPSAAIKRLDQKSLVLGIFLEQITVSVGDLPPAHIYPFAVRRDALQLHTHVIEVRCQNCLIYGVTRLPALRMSSLTA